MESKLKGDDTAPTEALLNPNKVTWGVESHILERFAQPGVPAEKVTMTKDTFTLLRPTRTRSVSSSYSGITMVLIPATFMRVTVTV